MFPNNMEFFVRERIAERYAEGEQHRLGQELAGQRSLALKRRLGKAIYRLGCQMISWSEMLQSHSTTFVAEESEQLTP